MTDEATDRPRVANEILAAESGAFGCAKRMECDPAGINPGGSLKRAITQISIQKSCRQSTMLPDEPTSPECDVRSSRGA
jgi:hypothetical protein